MMSARICRPGTRTASGPLEVGILECLGARKNVSSLWESSNALPMKVEFLLGVLLVDQSREVLTAAIVSVRTVLRVT